MSGDLGTSVKPGPVDARASVYWKERRVAVLPRNGLRKERFGVFRATVVSVMSHIVRTK